MCGNCKAMETELNAETQRNERVVKVDSKKTKTIESVLTA